MTLSIILNPKIFYYIIYILKNFYIYTSKCVFYWYQFNPAFYAIGDETVTFKFIDANYLRSTNYAISRAAYTQFYGLIYAIGGISGDGSQSTSLNASKSSSGTLTVSRGGVGITTLNTNQVLIDNGSSSFIQSSNLIWNNTTNTLSATNTTNTLSATNFVGSGSGLNLWMLLI